MKLQSGQRLMRRKAGKVSKDVRQKQAEMARRNPRLGGKVISPLNQFAMRVAVGELNRIPVSVIRKLHNLVIGTNEFLAFIGSTLDVLFNIRKDVD